MLFVCTNLFNIVINTTECYVPVMLINISENKFRIGGFVWIAVMSIHVSLELEDSCGLLS